MIIITFCIKHLVMDLLHNQKFNCFSLYCLKIDFIEMYFWITYIHTIYMGFEICGVNATRLYIFMKFYLFEVFRV